MPRAPAAKKKKERKKENELFIRLTLQTVSY